VNSLLKLINEFSAREILPVEVDDIVAYLRARGIKDEIYFFDADIDTDVLKGTIVHWEYQAEGWTYKVADIYTARTLTPEEKRMVQAKELLHILDHRVDRANTLEEVEILIKQMALPPSEIDWKTDSDHTRSDRSGILYALPVLFPMAVRDLFLPKLKEDKIDIDFIADIVALPKSAVGFVMSDLWAAVHPRIMAKLASELPIPDRVHAIDANQVTIEVYSVPLDDDPYTYAKRLEERSRDAPSPISAFIIETRRERRIFSRSELMAYTQRSPLKHG
jgi:hypothetical protein